MVLPSELEKSSVSGRKALKKFFVASSISGAHLLEEEAIRSMAGKFCVPLESRPCFWSGRRCHPEDLQTCELTGLSVHSEYITLQPPPRLEILFNILNGTKSKSDKTDLWADIASNVSKLLKGGSCKVENAELSSNGENLAVALEIKTWIGLKTRHAGLIYSIQDNTNVGRIVMGKRSDKGWVKS